MRPKWNGSDSAEGHWWTLKSPRGATGCRVKQTEFRDEGHQLEQGCMRSTMEGQGCQSGLGVVERPQLEKACPLAVQADEAAPPPL